MSSMQYRCNTPLPLYWDCFFGAVCEYMHTCCSATTSTWWVGACIQPQTFTFTHHAHRAAASCIAPVNIKAVAQCWILCQCWWLSRPLSKRFHCLTKPPLRLLHVLLRWRLWRPLRKAYCCVGNNGWQGPRQMGSTILCANIKAGVLTSLFQIGGTHHQHLLLLLFGILSNCLAFSDCDQDRLFSQLQLSTS